VIESVDLIVDEVIDSFVVKIDQIIELFDLIVDKVILGLKELQNDILFE
jgi:hypothetical protein